MTSTIQESTQVTDEDLNDVRVLLEDALRSYAENAPDGLEPVAGVTAEELANNVRGWTHTTRLRDFVAGVRRAGV